MQVYFQSFLWSYLPRVSVILTTTVCVFWFAAAAFNHLVVLPKTCVASPLLHLTTRLPAVS